MVVKLVWLTDLHFVADGDVLGHDPRVRLTAAVEFIRAHLPDAEACVITGDLVDLASEGAYAALAELLDRLPMPVLPLVGNHDDRTLLRQALPLPESVMGAFVQYAVDLPGAALLCLDTLIPGQDAGELCDDRLRWIEAELARAGDRPVILAMHHPPLKLGLPMLDPDNLQNGTQLLDLLSRYPNVAMILAGHVHRPIAGVAQGLPFHTQRAVLYQAPAPVPAWDWDSFAPPREAPGLGVVSLKNGQVTVQDLQFCPYEQGGAL